MITLEQARRGLARHRPRADDGPGAEPAAVALVVVPCAMGLEALFIRRAVRAGDPWSGQVGLPGGRQARSDQDLAATAIRETREELAVELTSAEGLGVLDDMRPRTPVLPPVFVRPFVYALAARPQLTPSREVESAFWASLARFQSPGVRRDVTIPLPGTRRSFPAYVLDRDVIWGMTERIITGFLEIISGDQ
jgi:8-oxo-dGTP pyrophosphatase MutT (NUDIX family)